MLCKTCNEINIGPGKEAGRVKMCTQCYRNYEKERRRKHRAALSTQTRTCPDCGEEHHGPGYTLQYCPKCFKARESQRKAIWRNNNREKDRSRINRYEQKHRRKVLKRKRKYAHKIGTPRNKLRRREAKRRLITEHGGRCIICGYNKNMASLTFHHPDPDVKELSISTLINRYGLERARIEAEKCDLVCNNCHYEIHHPELSL